MKKLGDVWCVVMHSESMWPIHEEYQCRTCGRRHPVPWAAATQRPGWLAGLGKVTKEPAQ